MSAVTCQHLNAAERQDATGRWFSYCTGCGVEVAASGVDGGSWVPYQRHPPFVEPTPPAEPLETLIDRLVEAGAARELLLKHFKSWPGGGWSVDWCGKRAAKSCPTLREAVEAELARLEATP